MRKREAAFCLFCFLTGYLAPWGFIIGGGAMGIFANDPYWKETAAWFLAIGFFLLCLSYLFARAFNRFAHDHPND